MKDNSTNYVTIHDYINKNLYHINISVDAVFEKSTVAHVSRLTLSSGILGATLLWGHLNCLGTPPARRVRWLEQSSGGDLVSLPSTFTCKSGGTFSAMLHDLKTRGGFRD